MSTIRQRKRGRHVFVWLVLIVSMFAGYSQAATFDVPQADVAKLIVADTGQILFAKNDDIPLPPASLAKMMTMLLTLEALERGELQWDELVRVSSRAASVQGSKIWLAEGDQLTVEQLLWAVSIQSANDASIALAERVAGTEEAFVARMNQKAESLNLETAYFTNSHGLPGADSEGQQTRLSASDAVAIGREIVLRFPIVLEWTSQWNKPLGEGTRNPIVLENTNRLVLTSSLPIDGLKTGHTSEAGYQLLATAEQDGLRLISIVMGTETAQDRYDATERLLRYGFNAFSAVQIRDEDGTAFSVHIPGAADVSYVQLEKPITVLVPKDGEGTLEHEIQLYELVEAPVEANEEIGELIVWVDGYIASQVPVYSVDDVPRAGFFRRQWLNAKDWISGLF